MAEMILINKKITVDNPLILNLRHIAKYDNVGHVDMFFSSYYNLQSVYFELLFTTARLITYYNGYYNLR